MAHFKGILRSDRGEVIRLGHKKLGLIVDLNAWDHGCRVELTHNAETGQDEIRVYKTGGSHDVTNAELVKSWSV